MTEKIIDKIKEIKQYLREFEEIKPVNFESYKNDLKEKAACERYFEKIIEAVVDLSFLIIREKHYEIPDDDKSIFGVLNKNRIISDSLTIKLKEAKGMRNILAHEYGKIDDELVFESISHELIEDVEELLKQVNKNFEMG